MDDEPGIGLLLARLLADQGEVEVVGLGNEVLRRVAAGARYDAILCDLGLPDLSGAAVFRALERQTPQQAARVIFLSGGADPEAERLLEGVSNPRLGKPCRRADLLRAIESVLT